MTIPADPAARPACLEHQFPEEETPFGVRLLLPCLLCGLAAGDGLQLAKRDYDTLEAELEAQAARLRTLEQENKEVRIALAEAVVQRCDMQATLQQRTEERDTAQRRYDTVKHIHDNGLDIVYQKLDVKNFKDALMAVNGLQERVKFTEDFDRLRFKLEAAEATITRLRARCEIGKANAYKKLDALARENITLDYERGRQTGRCQAFSEIVDAALRGDAHPEPEPPK